MLLIFTLTFDFQFTFEKTNKQTNRRHQRCLVPTKDLFVRLLSRLSSLQRGPSNPPSGARAPRGSHSLTKS